MKILRKLRMSRRFALQGAVGGIGVSGLSEEEDERIANAAIKNVFRK